MAFIFAQKPVALNNDSCLGEYNFKGLRDTLSRSY